MKTNRPWSHFHKLLLLVAVFIPSLNAQEAGSQSTTGAFSSSSQNFNTTTSVAVSSDYVLKPNDVVSVKVFQEDDLSCQERIAGDGTIEVPLIGRIKLAGLTPVSASHAVNAAFKQGYLVNPQTTVSISEATKEYITLLGQVSSPGPIELPPTAKVTLLQAIGMGGGFTRLANPSKVTIKRSVGGRETIIKVDAKKLTGKEGAESVSILPGDIITVSERLF